MMATEAIDTDNQQHELAKVLASPANLIAKVQAVMRLGFSEEVADDLVERHQLGQRLPVYYERLVSHSVTDDS